jgi:mono/diheme cytochrome c family protein
MKSYLKASLGFVHAILVASGTIVHAETVIERGQYLVNAAAACRSCHTPKDPSAIPLSGGARFGSGEAVVFSPNITPDVETGIGSWSKQQIVTAIRQGIRPDSSRIGPPMPQGAYKFMTDADADAIADYLKSIPSVHHSVPRKTSEERSSSQDRPSPAATQAAPADDTISRGRYIVTALTHCFECHDRGSGSSVASDQGPDQKDHLFRGPWGVIAAPSIAPEALTAYTDTQLAKVVTTGVRPDGSSLTGPMPIAAYAGLKPDDLAAIMAYLRSPTR